MAQIYSTPGVYIEEKSAFPSSAVAVATAIPAFIGYTEKHHQGDITLLNKPTRITSLAEYQECFGGAPEIKFIITQDKEKKYILTVDPLTKYTLYNALRLFFANGGSTCYIVSVGVYNYEKGVEPAILNPTDALGLNTLLKESEPTMVVIPDAIALPQEDCYELQQKMLQHCGVDMRNRIALLDVYDGFRETNEVIEKFREGIGNNNLQWGAAYYPWLETTIVSDSEVGIHNIVDPDKSLKTILETEAKLLYPLVKDKEGKMVEDPKLINVMGIVNNLSNPDASLHKKLLALIPLYNAIHIEIRNQLNILPPSAAMAGVITMVDNTVGVAKSPANVSIAKVVRPCLNISNSDQEDLNLPLNGKAVNAIRSFPGKGVLVWGARTLDGNSQDWRYINVRRTIIMLEQSLKNAAEAYVFEPNTSNTWVTIKAMMTNFLTDQWKRGALAGATPENAFSVDVGLGVTMTPTDILDGIMNISIKLAVVRPAEFIVITIQQQMQKS